MALAIPLIATVLSGCHPPASLHTPARFERGVVFVLPGIEGRSLFNRNLAIGLDQGGVTSAIVVHDWTSGVPGALVYNLVNIERNRREAKRLAQRIVDYQRDHPSGPVHLVGHSGGGGLVVLTLEALPDDVDVEMALLLAPALSPGHDLSAALERTRYGIVNFYSKHDQALLGLGTTVFGAVDREYGAAAGAVGFKVPASLDDSGRALYRKRLRQVRWTRRLRREGADGSHIGWTTRKFAKGYLAPLIKRQEAARPMWIQTAGTCSDPARWSRPVVRIATLVE